MFPVYLWIMKSNMMKEVALAFTNCLNSICKCSSSTSFQAIKRNQEDQYIDFTTNKNHPYNNGFSLEELISALSSCFNTAPGKNLISFKILKCVNDNCQQFILELYNFIWVEETFPHIWNTAITLPFLKPWKDLRNPSSYRPITLTVCCV